MRTPQQMIVATVVVGVVFSPLAATAKIHGKAGSAGIAAHAVKAGQGGRAQVLYVQNCPPGLARKSPSCVPPGQAKKSGLRVGDVIDLGSAHIVTRPGAYGLSTPPAGDRYAIVDGRLVRVDPDSGKVLSILRLIDAILD